MYIAGLVIPVPEDQRDSYRAWAANSAAFFKEYGCLEIVEAWEDYVPDGKQTDFRRAVAARPGEKIVFTWQIWPVRRQPPDPRLLRPGVHHGPHRPPVASGVCGRRVLPSHP